jgi:hypothetical protein
MSRRWTRRFPMLMAPPEAAPFLQQRMHEIVSEVRGQYRTWIVLTWISSTRPGDGRGAVGIRLPRDLPAVAQPDPGFAASGRGTRFRSPHPAGYAGRSRRVGRRDERDDRPVPANSRRSGATDPRARRTGPAAHESGGAQREDGQPGIVGCRGGARNQQPSDVGRRVCRSLGIAAARHHPAG